MKMTKDELKIVLKLIIAIQENLLNFFKFEILETLINVFYIQ